MRMLTTLGHQRSSARSRRSGCLVNVEVLEVLEAFEVLSLNTTRAAAPLAGGGQAAVRKQASETAYHVEFQELELKVPESKRWINCKKRGVNLHRPAWRLLLAQRKSAATMFLCRDHSVGVP